MDDDHITAYNRMQFELHQDELSRVQLPTVFAVYRNDVPDQRVPTEESHWMAGLITAERCPGTSTQWRFRLIRNPIDIIDTASVYREQNDHWLGGHTHMIMVQKLCRDPAEHGRLILTQIKFDGVVMSIVGANHIRQQIPCFEVNTIQYILGSRFQELNTPRYAQYRFYLRPGEPIIRSWTNVMEGAWRDPAAILQRIDERLLRAQQPSQLSANRGGGFFQRLLNSQQNAVPQAAAPPPSPAVPTPSAIAAPLAPAAPLVQSAPAPSMPQHVVNRFIDTEIASGAICSIAREALTRDTACLTPCGHVYSFDEVARWIQGGHSCPECRAACSVAQLQRWSAR